MKFVCLSGLKRQEIEDQTRLKSFYPEFHFDLQHKLDELVMSLFQKCNLLLTLRSRSDHTGEI